MDSGEMRMLLAQVAAYDNRRLGDGVLAVWMNVFDSYSYDEVRWALYHHMKTSTEYLMPAHLTSIIDWKRSEYRMMNPGRHLDNDAWLEFEGMLQLASQDARSVRATAARTAVEAMESGEFDEA